MSRWGEAFAIFERNGMGEFDVSAEHDEVYVHLPNILTTSPDGQRLRELGWFKEALDYDVPEDEQEYDEDSSWKHYV